jgi:hypothetical protein
MSVYQYVVCNREGCAYQDIVRRVERPIIGPDQGMLGMVAVSCECSPDIEMRRVAPPEPEPVLSLSEAFIGWVRDEGLIGSEPPC